MPALNLSDDFTEQLGQSGPGVAVYSATGRTALANIYMGLKLDGLKRYENISSIKMQFAPKPVVLCNEDELDFDPNEDELITIKVSRRLY